MKKFLIFAVLLSGCWSLPPIGPPGPPPVPNIITAECLNIITVRQPLTSASVDRMIGDTTYWEGLRSRCHTYYHLTPKSAADYTMQIGKAGGPPCVIFMDAKTRKELASVKLPDTESAFDALVKKYSGK